MSTNKLHTSTKSRPRNRCVSVGYDSANGNSAMRSLLETLEPAVGAHPDDNGPSGSNTSPSSSASRDNYSASSVSPVSPCGHALGALPTTPPRDTNVETPQQPRRTSDNLGVITSSLASLATPRRLGNEPQSPHTPQGLAMGGSRAMLARQDVPVQSTPVVQCPVASSLKGIPEVLAVQEMAFRQGQLDHGIIREHLPSSPFAKHFDHVWLEHYVLGREIGGTPISPSSIQQSSTLENFPWPVLINPYTQDLQHPDGGVDPQWVRKICCLALDCMTTLIASVCKRQYEWKRTVCDVPSPIRQALIHFDDLEMRYQGLLQDAKSALGGGLPSGY